MSKQIFLNVEQVLDLIIGELPAGVYAEDRADDTDTTKRSYSSSELRAHSQMFANLYSNLESINKDKFASTVTPEGLAPWEKEYFADAQDASQSYAIRQANILSKIRSDLGINQPSIENIVGSILTPAGLSFQILAFSGQNNGTGNGAWILGRSALGFDTYLALQDPLIGETRDEFLTPLDCSLDYAAAGLTLTQLQQIQATAYTYAVMIYGNADAMTLALLDKRLTEQEPARSTHLIFNNAIPPSTPPDAGTEQWNANYLYWWVS
jgi:hypothetical protein